MASTVLTPDAYFLSATNPAATADQRDIEAMALKVYQMPALANARQQAAGRWKMCMGRNVPEETWTRFDQFMEEWCFSFALKAVNSDANYPKVMGQLFSSSHEWFGAKVPGSRAGGADNPDNNYILIPIDGHARFELSGRRFNPGPADCPIVVTGDLTLVTTLAVLDWQDVELNADGSFVITIGPEPANGRRNHLQTKLEARYIFLRECRSDWRQISVAYRIKRLDPPAAPPITMEQMADRAAQFMVFEVPAGHFFFKMIENIPPNVVAPPFGTGAVGGLVTQMMSFGRAKFADDEAFVVTTTLGGAKYCSLTMGDPIWMMSLDCSSRSGSANTSHFAPNSDGSMTYVISLSDPGVHNWMDPSGFKEVTLLYRWQGLPKSSGTAETPTIKGNLVKLKDLDSVLPKDTKRVTPTERKRQFAERTETFKLRYVDR